MLQNVAKQSVMQSQKKKTYLFGFWPLTTRPQSVQLTLYSMQI